MSDWALDVDRLVKQYKGTLALDRVSLQIGKGEIFALLGPNGAGKTTLIGAVCGLVKKTRGTIRIFGMDVDDDPIAPRYRVGLVPQEINFDPFFTTEESLRIQLGYYGQKPDEARITEMLRELKLESKRKAITRTLSGGMRRRLLIAKALVHRPQLVFLDEPTAGVDVELRRDLWSYVKRLRAEGTTVVLTTHYLEEAEELADRVGVIDQGKLLLVEEKASLMRRMGERKLEVTFHTPLTTLPSLAQAGAELSPDRTRLVYTERPDRATAGEVLKALYQANATVADVETRRSRLEDILLNILHQPVSPAVPESELGSGNP